MRALLFLLTILIAAQSMGQSKGTVGGRFQLIQLSEFRRDQFLVDTQTGKLWQKVCVIVDGEKCIGEHFELKAIEGITADRATLRKIIKEIEEENGRKTSSEGDVSTSK